MSGVEQPLVTIYTQSYNGEKYIAQCIESVLKQTYHNFEYFICNHGSADATLSIIEEYASQDERIRVINRPNSDRGFYPELIAREGTGKYFSMLDSDDYWDEKYLEKLVCFAEDNNLDMAVCGINAFVDGQTGIRVLRKPYQKYVYLINENEIYFPEIYNFLRTTWGKVIRMDILRLADYSTYKENAKDFISDDTAFTLANYEKCKRIGAIPEVLLYYRFSDGSVTAKYNPKRIDNNINIHKFTLSMLETIGDTGSNSRQFADKVFLASIQEACKLLFESDRTYDYKISEVKRVLETDLMQRLLHTTNEASIIVRNIVQYVLLETQECKNITEADVETLKYINGLLKSLGI